MSGQPSTPARLSPSPRSGSRLKKWVMVIITVGIILPGGYGFIEKFIQFVRTLRTDDAGGFTIIPICNYLIVTAGMACLLVWATARGMFRDIERPKFTMLEREQQIEAGDRDTGRMVS